MEGLMYARGGEESGIAVRAAGTFKTPACAQNTGKVDPLGVPAARKASPLGGWSPQSKPDLFHTNGRKLDHEDLVRWGRMQAGDAGGFQNL